VSAPRASNLTLSLLPRPLELHRPALADAAIYLRFSSHAESSSARRTHAMALRQACHRPAASYFVLGLGGLAHLNVSLTRSDIELLFQHLLVSFLYMETVLPRVLLRQTIPTARSGRPLFSD